MTANGAPTCTEPCQRQRRVAAAIIALLVAGTSPVIGHHVPLPLQHALGGIDHIGGVCVAALHELFRPVHWSFHLVLIGGLAFALVERMGAWRRLRHALAPLASHAPDPGDPFLRAAALAGLDASRLRLVRGLPNPVFTTGFFRPVVFVAEDLAVRLPESELVAVLAHEAAHVRRRDPLSLTVLRGVAHAFFWLPLIRRLTEDFAEDAELAADDFAARRAGRLSVAAALVSLAGWPRDEIREDHLVAFRTSPLVARRVRRLLGEACPAPSHVTRPAVAIALLALSAVWGTGLLMAHPMPPADTRGAHCTHHASPAHGHLFCKVRHSAADPCPHAAEAGPATLAAQ